MRHQSPYFFILFSLLIFSCEDPTMDFTSGSFYPVKPTSGENTTTPIDTTKDNSTGTTPTRPPEKQCWDSTVTVELSTYYNNLFTRFGDGWTGADGTLSILLPDKRRLWIFGDTFLGTVSADRSRSGGRMYNNSLMIQNGSEMKTIIGGNGTITEAFARPPESDWWYWPAHGQVNKDTLELLFFAMKKNGTGAWAFEYAAVDLIKYTLPDLKKVSWERKINNMKINYGTSVLIDNDYIYLYGSEKIGFSKLFHVARCPKGSLSQTWSYYTQNGWSNDISQAKGSLPDLSDQYSVIKRGNIYYLISQGNLFSKQITRYTSSSPTGPFQKPLILYCTPERMESIYTYNAFVHEETGDPNTLLISYNINSFNFADVFKNADNYRPKFITVKNWQ